MTEPTTLVLPLARLRSAPGKGADFLLQASVRVWFGVMLIGQWLFVVHIAGFYGRTALAGDFVAWNKLLIQGWIAGDRAGNTALAVHLALAAYLSFAGVLQLIPQVRTALPRLHRINGRVYALTAVIASVTALYLSFARSHPPGTEWQQAAIEFNGFLILLFAAQAYASARARRFDAHRRHAIRLFLAVSGVWFFRVEVFGWVLLNGGPRGFDADTFQGPALTVFAFAQFVLPLAAFWLYEHARIATSRPLKRATAAVLALLTGLMGTGLFAVAASWF